MSEEIGDIQDMNAGRAVCPGKMQVRFTEIRLDQMRVSRDERVDDFSSANRYKHVYAKQAGKLISNVAIDENDWIIPTPGNRKRKPGYLPESFKIIRSQ